LKDVTHIAMDEIAIRKGHKYLTVVMDLHTGRVIFVGDGRSAEALDPFWKRLKKSRANIIAVCSDMSAAYTKAIRNHLPGAIHVFDRLHVIKLFNDKLSDLRRRLQSETKDKEAKEALKGIRFDLLKREPSEQGAERLEKALALNADLAVAHTLKELLSELWEIIVGQGVTPCPQHQTGRAGFQASGFPIDFKSFVPNGSFAYDSVHIEFVHCQAYSPVRYSQIYARVLYDRGANFSR
jgi:hypothetical protein